jgi:tol-pal system protein YbgF
MFIRSSFLYGLLFIWLLGWQSSAFALFEDNEARKAILDLRNEQKLLRGELNQLRSSLLGLQTQIELTKQAAKNNQGQLTQLERNLNILVQTVERIELDFDTRLRQLEPIQIDIEGVQVFMSRKEKETFDGILKSLESADYQQAKNALLTFNKDYPESAYHADSLFWLGNVDYVLENYNSSINNFTRLVEAYPQYSRTPEAMLGIANAQLQSEKPVEAKKTLLHLLEKYPDTHLTDIAKKRLADIQ